MIQSMQRKTGWTKLKITLAITGLAAVFFLPFLGRVHLFDWDEINFAECAREMMKLHDYSRVYVNFQPFWEKPPMFFWLQTVSMRLFGIGEFAARLPNAVCGIVTLPVLYLCGRRIYGHRFGLLWALAYGGSLFPNMYFKSGIIDPWFNLFSFLSFYFFILYHWKRNGFDKPGLEASQLGYVLASAACMGIAILIKGQVALMVFLLTLGVYWIYNRFRIYFNWWHALLFLVVATAVTSTWYAYETLKNGPWFIEEFLRYQYRLFSTHDADQKGFLGYHYIVILIGCFPSSVFAIPAFFRGRYEGKFDRDFKVWMIILFWVVTGLFTVVQSRIIHYSSLAWFPVSFLAAYTFYGWERGSLARRKWVSVLAASIGGIIALALLAVPWLATHLNRLIPYVHDRFAQGNMEAQVPWTGWESLVGLLLVLTLWFGVRLLRKGAFGQAALCYFGGTAVVVFLASAIIVPKVERYSQGAAIDFFIAKRGEDCYMNVLGYKSYAQLFYFQKEKPVNPDSYLEAWLLRGNIDKPAYFVSKVDRVDNYLQTPGLRELYRKNGFVFLRRDPPEKP